MKRQVRGNLVHANKDYVLDVKIEKKQSLMGFHTNTEDFLRISTSLPKQVPVARGFSLFWSLKTWKRHLGVWNYVEQHRNENI